MMTILLEQEYVFYLRAPFKKNGPSTERKKP